MFVRGRRTPAISSEFSARGRRLAPASKEFVNAWPVLPHDHVGAQMPAPPKQVELYARQLRKLLHRAIRHKRIILGMKHHDLRPIDLTCLMRRVIELPGIQLSPVFVRDPIPVAESLSNIGGVIRVGGLRFLRLAQDRPIHHRTIRDDFLHSTIERAKNGRGASEASPDDKHIFDSRIKPLPKSSLPKLSRESVDHIKNVQMRRPFQKLTPALPSPAIPRIEHPISL